MLWIKMNWCSEIKWQNVSLSKNNKKIIASKIINWKNKKKKSLTTFFDVIPILWCYTQIKNPKHPHEEDRDNWLEVDRQKRSGSKVDGGVGLRLIGGLGRLVGQWRQTSVVATLRMSRTGGDERVSLRERCWESKLERVLRDGASDESDWERGMVWE